MVSQMPRQPKIWRRMSFHRPRFLILLGFIPIDFKNQFLYGRCVFSGFTKVQTALSCEFYAGQNDCQWHNPRPRFVVDQMALKSVSSVLILLGMRISFFWTHAMHGNFPFCRSCPEKLDYLSLLRCQIWCICSQIRRNKATRKIRCTWWSYMQENQPDHQNIGMLLSILPNAVLHPKKPGK